MYKRHAMHRKNLHV
nr:unnamed protein product [Callosobruchus analis]